MADRCECPECTKPEGADYGCPQHGEHGWRCGECRDEVLPEHFIQHAKQCRSQGGNEEKA